MKHIRRGWGRLRVCIYIILGTKLAYITCSINDSSFRVIMSFTSLSPAHSTFLRWKSFCAFGWIQTNAREKPGTKGCVPSTSQRQGSKPIVCPTSDCVRVCARMRVCWGTQRGWVKYMSSGKVVPLFESQLRHLLERSPRPRFTSPWHGKWGYNQSSNLESLRRT